MAVPAELVAALAQQQQCTTQLQAGMAQLTEAVAQLMQLNAKKPGERSDQDVRKALDRMETFDGKIEKWKEWSYKFSVITQGGCRKTGHLMGLVERMDENVNSEDMGLDMSADEAEWMHVRCVEDRNGYMAWKKLYERYNPRTPASLMTAWCDVVQIKKSKDPVSYTHLTLPTKA